MTGCAFPLQTINSNIRHQFPLSIFLFVAICRERLHSWVEELIEFNSQKIYSNQLGKFLSRERKVEFISKVCDGRSVCKSCGKYNSEERRINRIIV